MKFEGMLELVNDKRVKVCSLHIERVLFVFINIDVVRPLT